MPGGYWLLVPLGLVVGIIGTLIGAGGGFILVPVLLFVYPELRPEEVTAISLAVVFANAASGSLAYARMGRIDYRGAAWFAAASLPGAVLGALTVGRIPRRLFFGLFGALMIAVSTLIIHRSARVAAAAGEGQRAADRPHLTRRELGFGLGLSGGIGYLASLLGIGGGIIHVPALVHFLRYPVHVATATSHLVLAFVALTATVVHLAMGVFQTGWRRTTLLAIGVLVGAQLGARLSARVRGRWIIAGLGAALLVVGLRLVWGALRG